MKKNVGVLVVLALMFSLVACNNSNNAVKPGQNNNVVNENVQNENNTPNDGENPPVENNSTGATKYIAQGRFNQYDEQQLIDLPEDAINDYVWKYTIEDESVVKLASEDYVASEADEGVTVSGGLRIYFFEGLKEGESNVTFRNDVGAETVTYLFKVDAEKNIAIVSETVEK